MDYEKNDILRESKQLYGEINSCITDIVNARIAKDPYNEGRAIFRMEELMVGTMQHLGCVIDFLEQGERVVIEGKDIVCQLENQKEQKPAEWSEEDEEMLEYIIGDVNDATQLYATREAKDMADKEIAWLKSLRPQPKQEWSKEDEKIRGNSPKWVAVKKGTSFDKPLDFILSTNEGRFYCSANEVPRDGYMLLIDDLEQLPRI